jgi:hypothetical protein
MSYSVLDEPLLKDVQLRAETRIKLWEEFYDIFGYLLSETAYAELIEEEVQKRIDFHYQREREILEKLQNVDVERYGHLDHILDRLHEDDGSILIQPQIRDVPEESLLTQPGTPDKKDEGFDEVIGEDNGEFSDQSLEQMQDWMLNNLDKMV